MITNIKMERRNCDGCTKCCEGYLSSIIHGKRMQPGMPCHFKCKTGCSIYEDRPKDPCIDYNCEWLVNPEIPGWMKPDEVNAVITKRKINGIEYFEIIEAGEKLKVEVLDWILQNLVIEGKNVRYHISGGVNLIGSPEFQKAFTSAMTRDDKIQIYRTEQ